MPWRWQVAGFLICTTWKRENCGWSKVATRIQRRHRLCIWQVTGVAPRVVVTCQSTSVTVTRSGILVLQRVEVTQASLPPHLCLVKLQAMFCISSLEMKRVPDDGIWWGEQVSQEKWLWPSKYLCCCSNPPCSWGQIRLKHLDKSPPHRQGKDIKLQTSLWASGADFEDFFFIALSCFFAQWNLKGLSFELQKCAVLKKCQCLLDIQSNIALQELHSNF